MIWRNDWDARAGEAVARIAGELIHLGVMLRRGAAILNAHLGRDAVNDYDAKIPHSPPNERLEDVMEDEEEVVGNDQPRQVA